jgi:UDP-2,3-diacylglucosamine pyrophosphatase LpxH
MKQTSFLTNMASRHFIPDLTLDLTSCGGRALILSDLHMGTGKRDDLADNGDLLVSLLEDYYFPQGWYLVLNGDIEELQRYSLERIMKSWKRLYAVFDLFAGQNRLYKLIGNHDDELLLDKSYPYPLYDVIRIENGVIPAYVFHGHQLSYIYSKYNKVLRAGIRYVLKPFGIKNVSSGRNSNRRFHIEKAAYNFSINMRCISIIGHTHRPLFESFGRFDYIKFEIERLIRDYPASSEEKRRLAETNVMALRRELGKLKNKERQDVIKHNVVYGDEIPVPCLFNSGCTIGKKGLHAIEISCEDIALVYWYTEGKGRRFISRGGYDIEKNGNNRRAILNRDRLDYIYARIKLLGGTIT